MLGDLFHIHAVKSKHGQKPNQSCLDPKFSSVSAPDTWEHRKEKEFHGNLLTDQFHPREKMDLHVQNNTIFTRSDHGFRMSVITCQQILNNRYHVIDSTAINKYSSQRYALSIP